MIAVACIRQGLDTSTPSGRAMFQMLGVFAEFERAMIRERVMTGLARARAEGKQQSNSQRCRSPMLSPWPRGSAPPSAAQGSAASGSILSNAVEVGREIPRFSLTRIAFDNGRLSEVVQPAESFVPADPGVC
jgi:DNA invertase Pin-like site-specific DNA recombinase